MVVFDTTHGQMVVFDTTHAEKQGRIAMREEIVADLDKRIAILTESIKNPKHTFSERTALMVTQRALEVARADYASRT